jgi:hypothetical protein
MLLTVPGLPSLNLTFWKVIWKVQSPLIGPKSPVESDSRNIAGVIASPILGEVVPSLRGRGLRKLKIAWPAPTVMSSSCDPPWETARVTGPAPPARFPGWTLRFVVA